MAVPNEPITLPMLFKIDSKGKTRCWRTWSTLNEDGTATEHNEAGVFGGKMSGIPIVVSSGKNIGKKNETTPLQVANRRIMTKHDKKLREGYVADLNDFEQKGVMKAMDWRTNSHRMPEIALHQPKIDGIRCKFEKNLGDFKLLSKGNKEFKEYLKALPWAQHIDSLLEEGQEVDGELYIHGLELNEINSLVSSYKYTTEEILHCSKDTEEGLVIGLPPADILDQLYVGEFCPNEDDIENGIRIRKGRKTVGMIFPGFTMDDVETFGTAQLQYWAFDMPQEEVFAEQRNYDLRDLLDNDEARDAGIIALIAEEFNTSDIESVNEQYVEQGFEGTMIRSFNGYYAYGERTADLQKYKLFYDAEWEIIGYTLDRQGNPNFTFRSQLGHEFDSRPKGNQAWRLKILRDMDQLIGKRATLRYQKLIAETMIPQFSRVIAIRDYE